MRVFQILSIGTAAVLALSALAGCADIGDTTASAGSHTASTGSELSSVSARALTVQPFKMERGVGVLPGRIGERTTVGNVSMGYVTLSPPPEALFTEAIKSELVAAGHSVGAGSKRITGVVKRFALETPATATYWDVTIDAALEVSVGGTTRSYTEVCVARTYTGPSDRLISQVSNECVSKIAGQFANDRSIANAL